MKILILLTCLFGIQAQALQQTDQACLQNCLNQGSMYGYCSQTCSYEITPVIQQAAWPSQTDTSIKPIRNCGFRPCSDDNE